MASRADTLIVSPNICSLTDQDGTIILDTERDAIYSVIGVGSLIWKKLAVCQSGLSFNTIVGELGAEFKDVPRQQIECDAERLLESFRQKRLVQQIETNPGRFAQAKRGWTIAGFILLSRMTVRLLPKFKLNILAAFLGLATINLMLKVVGFRAVYQSVKLWPINNNTTPPEAEREVCDAVDTATTLYPKQAMCLQRSAVTTCLLRQYGMPAQMVIGCRKIPFKAHAWVEIEGRVVNDKKQVQEFYRVLDRC